MAADMKYRPKHFAGKCDIRKLKSSGNLKDSIEKWSKSIHPKCKGIFAYVEQYSISNTFDVRVRRNKPFSKRSQEKMRHIVSWPRGYIIELKSCKGKENLKRVCTTLNSWLRHKNNWTP